jgi:hypothetical protein
MAFRGNTGNHALHIGVCEVLGRQVERGLDALALEDVEQLAGKVSRAVIPSHGEKAWPGALIEDISAGYK